MKVVSQGKARLAQMEDASVARIMSMRHDTTNTQVYTLRSVVNLIDKPTDQAHQFEQNLQVATAALAEGVEKVIRYIGQR